MITSNNWDWGRQIQMSHYSGPARFESTASGLPGDGRIFPGTRCRLATISVTRRRSSTTKTTANICTSSAAQCSGRWGCAFLECHYESWMALYGSMARVRCRMTAERSDHSFYPPFSQEMPALYLNGAYHRLFSYTGDKPFKDGALTSSKRKSLTRAAFRGCAFWPPRIGRRPSTTRAGEWVSGSRHVSRSWAVFPASQAKRRHEGYATGYIAPVRREIIDHNIVFEDPMCRIVALDDIRKQAIAAGRPPAAAEWKFRDDRQGWTYENANDSGWPIKECSRCRWKSPRFTWSARSSARKRPPRRFLSSTPRFPVRSGE